VLEQRASVLAQLVLVRRASGSTLPASWVRRQVQPVQPVLPERASQEVSLRWGTVSPLSEMPVHSSQVFGRRQ